METVMDRIEFETIVYQGIIELPREHIDKVHGHVRVIIVNAEEEDDVDMVEYLMQHPLTVIDGKPLSREEIYDRGR
jgi:hypothetical protein